MTPLSKNARAGGLLYILNSLFGLVRLVYPNELIVSGNASATANNIAGHELLYPFGIVSYLLCGALWILCHVGSLSVAKGVDQALAVLMVMGTLVITPIFFVNAANDAAALLFARGADFLSVFDKAQSEAFVMLFLNLHHQLDLAQEILWAVVHSVRTVGIQVAFPAANLSGLADDRPLCAFSHQL